MLIAAVVSYDGTDFGGWQRQINKITVQECIEDALFKLSGCAVKIVGSGRTDSGAHALCQVFHFSAPKKFALPPEKYAVCLNNILPKSIRILKSQTVANSFHARNSVVKKTYEYNMYESQTELPLKDRFSLRIDKTDTALMQEAANLLIGTYDFKAFSKTGSNVLGSVRTIYDISVKRTGSDIAVTVCGDGFLYNMVRIITGALLAIGQRKLDIDSLELAKATKKRNLLGKTLPARGLVLKNIEYGDIYKIY